jgi:hypothetical protein
MNKIAARFIWRILSLWVAVSLSACAAGNQTTATEVADTPGTAALAESSLLDDFEETATAWRAGQPPDYSDSSATGVTASAQNASHGAQALELSFAKTDAPKAIFYLEKGFNLSGGGYLEFDLYNPGGARAVAIALSLGNNWEWLESAEAPLTEGPQTVSFDLGAQNYKSLATGWEYTARLEPLNDTRRIAIIVYPSQTGSVFIDALRVSEQPGGQVTEVSAAPTATSILPKVANQMELKLLKQPGSIYEWVEFEIVTDGTYANPFDPDQVDLRLRFFGPDGASMEAPAFWYQEYDPQTLLASGAPGWRARFTPTLAGEWSAQALLQEPGRSNSEPLTSEKVTFQVAEDADAKGFVRLHPENPSYFAFDNGETYFPVGINMGWGSANPLEDYERWLDRLSANGGDIIRVWMASWSFGIEWNDTGLGDYTKRLQRAWLLDQVFRMAEERGVTIELVLLNHGAFSERVNPEWDNNPYNAANGGPCSDPAEFATDELARQLFQRRLRYIAARWAYSPALMAWEWWNEADWTPISNPQMAAWIKEMTPVLRSFDPYQHLISTSYAQRSTAAVNGLEEIDFSQMHMYNPSDPAIEFRSSYQFWAADIPGKPAMFAEYGASAGGEDINSDDQQGLHLHNALWASSFGGWASTAMYWWWDSYVDPLNLWRVFSRLTRFLDGEDMATLQVSKAVLSSREVPYHVLMNEERALAWLHDRKYELNALQKARSLAILANKDLPEDWVYLPEPINGLTLTLSGLSDGDYRAYWYSPNRGEWLEAVEMRVDGGKATLEVPEFQGDVAVKLIPAAEADPTLP